MNMNRILSRAARSVALSCLLWAAAGCKHAPARSTMAVTDTQAPVMKSVPRPTENARESEMQRQIDLMQEQISILTARAQTLAAFHQLRMPPKWSEKVQAARADASRHAERMRYLEATKDLLARKLQALRNEIKVYEEFQASDPAIPRP
jgi:hypothetical protein